MSGPTDKAERYQLFMLFVLAGLLIDSIMCVGGLASWLAGLFVCCFAVDVPLDRAADCLFAMLGPWLGSRCFVCGLLVSRLDC